MSRPLLTDEEHRLMDRTGDLAEGLLALCGDNVHDRREAAFYVHGIQNMILAQAAARRYPTRYRLLGEDAVVRTEVEP